MAYESNLQKRVIKLINNIPNTWLINVHGGGRFQKSGVPDILICHEGRFRAIELKAPGEEPSKLQYAVGKKISTAGGDWIWSSNYDEIKEWLLNG